VLVSELMEQLELTAFSLPEPDREISGGYAGDLLSWVMGRAEEDQAWITIMSNLNIVAVAALSGVSAVILSEGVKPDAGVAERALAQGINLLGSEKATFALCAELSALLQP